MRRQSIRTILNALAAMFLLFFFIFLPVTIIVASNEEITAEEHGITSSAFDKSTEPVTEIIGESEMYINKESTMNLTCVVRHSPEPPLTIYWTHDHEVINYDSPRGGVSVITEKGEVTTSYLLIQRAKPADSGQYTCHPSNANTKTVLVHVLNGEHPAAMQHGGQLRLANLPFVIISTTLLTILNHPY